MFQHANAVRKKHADIMERIERGEYNRKPPNFSVPPVSLLFGDSEQSAFFAMTLYSVLFMKEGWVNGR